eukprot:tig00000980_g6148.t1
MRHLALAALVALLATAAVVTADADESSVTASGGAEAEAPEPAKAAQLQLQEAGSRSDADRVVHVNYASSQRVHPAPEPAARAPQELSPTAHCNRFRSRVVRAIINEQVMPLVEENEVELPRECILHPDHDLLRLQEEQKKELWREQWKCGVCGKQFRSEFFLDKHLERRHSAFGTQNSSTCLADLCDVFDCAGVIADMHAKGTFPAEGEGLPTAAALPRGVGAAACSERAMSKRRLSCQAILQRCFPPEGTDAARYLNDLFEQKFCEALTCSERPLDAVRRAVAMRFTSGRVRPLYAALAALLLTALAVYYTLLWCSRARRPPRTLQRLPSARRWPLPFFARSKSKNF